MIRTAHRAQYRGYLNSFGDLSSALPVKLERVAAKSSLFIGVR